jgi:hypothetical protein
MVSKFGNLILKRNLTQSGMGASKYKILLRHHETGNYNFEVMSWIPDRLVASKKGCATWN